MRLKDFFALCLASLAAVVPWMSRGAAFADPRHQRRHEAAKILRVALRASRPSATTREDVVEHYRSAVSRAIQLAGPDSRAAAELTRAVTEVDGSDASSDGALRLLRDRVEKVCEDLAFVPIMEAEMPRGFPLPTPVGEIEVKQYPLYRMAETEADEGSAFWILFNHIKRNKIAMTAPVEMSYESTETSGPRQREMAFLYGSRGLGETGSDGSVRIVDVPPQTVVSIGVRGERTREKIASACGTLREWIKMASPGYQPAGQMRVMGYNSPFVPSRRKYFEVQIPITVDESSRAADDLRGEFDLSDCIWKNRVLLAFAPHGGDTSYGELRRSWAARSAAVTERDLLLVEVLEQGESRAGEIRLTASKAAKLREQFKVEPGLATFILIGKDGTVKLRRPHVRLSDLFGVIDAMPMRRAEMSRQSVR